jgi:hypothetical protein
VASLATIVAVGFVLDLMTPGASTSYSPDAFTAAMSVQYVVWTVGAIQIWRYRRETRRIWKPRTTEAGVEWARAVEPV